MNVRLTQPLPTINGRVLPIGMELDAPPAFKERLVAAGKAVWVDKKQDGGVAEMPTPVSPVKPKRKKV